MLAARFLSLLGRRAAPVFAAVALSALLIAPTVWPVISVQAGNGGAWLPEAGPASVIGFSGRGCFGSTPPQGQTTGTSGQQSGRTGTTTGIGAGGRAPRGANFGGGGNQAITYAGANWNPLNAGLTHYLLANQGSAKYLVATTTSSYASVFELATDQPALALGGHQG